MKKKIALIIAGAIALPALIAAAAPQSGADGDRADKWKARHAEMLQKFDTDHDGKLSDTEKAAMIHSLAGERFAKLDTNKDGALSPAEFEAGMKQMREHRFGGHRHHRDGGGNDGSGEPQ